VAYINFLFKTFKDCSKSIWTCSKANYHMVNTKRFPNSFFISSISMTIFNSSILMCDNMQKDETCNYTHKHVVASFHWWSSNRQHIATLTHDLVHAMAFHQVSKMWFRVVGESGAWNTLENIRVDHRSYLHTLKKTNNARQSFQAHLEFEVHCLETCLLASDVNIIAYDIDIKSYEDFRLNLEIPK
jgi:hypothetical protein